jgi:dTDP-4-dehydrorhamnose 3,5-epimerase
MIEHLDRHADHRGYFQELWRGGFQVNHSRSVRGVLRGLHFQGIQSKRVVVIRGTIWNVTVDIREHSPDYGVWRAMVLSEDEPAQRFVPGGFAHGFYVLSDVADVVYFCDEEYDPTRESGVIWNDPQIGIAWPLDGAPILSSRDASLPTLDNIKRARK